MIRPVKSAFVNADNYHDSFSEAGYSSGKQIKVYLQLQT